MGDTLEKKNRFRFPNTYVLLFAVAIIMAILTYIIPAGTFERAVNEATGRTGVVPGSFQFVEQTPAGFVTLFSSVFEGFLQAAELSGIILIMGSAVGVIINSGAMHALIAKAVKKFGQKTDMLFVVLMAAFTIASTIVGMCEELVIFIPLILAVCRALNYDDMTACAVIVIGLYQGLGFAPFSPYSTLIAQQIAEVELYSGLGIRVVGLIGGAIIGITYVLLYSRRCAKDPSKSVLYDKNIGGYVINSTGIKVKEFNLDDYQMTPKRKAIIILLVIAIIINVYGVMKYGWYFDELSCIYLILGVVCALIEYNGKINDAAEALIKEMGPLVGTCMLLAMSRSIIYVLNEGQIMDTIIYAISNPLSKLSGLVASWGIYISQLIVNFFIPSASGQAMAVMPIITPLCDICEIPRNVGVHAFMTADCYGNLIIPTHPTTLAILGMAGVSWTKWFKWVWKLVLLFSIWSLILISVGYYIWQ